MRGLRAPILGLLGAAPGLGASRRLRLRQGRAVLACMAALGTAVLACEDTPSTPASGLVLSEPLNLDWLGEDSGVPFDYRGVFHARANLRARWKFRIEARPADPNDPRWHGEADPPLYTTEFPSQDRILFTWRITDVNPNRNYFASGDTCTARVTLEPALAPGEEEKATFTFVIGG
ncbi:MAG TPA: hypothetical protein VFE28_14235 [Candidatus Krumholzibacteria bacterium]|nr:hypothetical protein [Candidatus Krumholzibacteria bacterium]